jgi:hypothetical protein
MPQGDVEWAITTAHLFSLAAPSMAELRENSATVSGDIFCRS